MRSYWDHDLINAPHASVNMVFRGRIVRQFAGMSAGAAAQGRSDGWKAHALQPHHRQRHALFSLNLLESPVHLHTLPVRRGVAGQI